MTSQTVTIERSKLELALEAFETLTQYNMVRANIFRRFEPTCTGDYVDLREFREKAKPAITALKEALAQQSNERVESVAVMELYTDGWDLVEGIDTDWLETLPFGTRLFSHPPVPTAQPEPEQEPVAIADGTFNHNCPLGAPLYTTPPQRTWVGLTDEESVELMRQVPHLTIGGLLAIEAKLKENT